MATETPTPAPTYTLQEGHITRVAWVGEKHPDYDVTRVATEDFAQEVMAMFTAMDARIRDLEGQNRFLKEKVRDLLRVTRSRKPL